MADGDPPRPAGASVLALILVGALIATLACAPEAVTGLDRMARCELEVPGRQMVLGPVVGATR